ncbi:MAG TPA: hypothetical protein VF096_02625, partial [Azonexus sp.]
YRLSKLLKNFFFRRAVSFDSSAAERRDYEELLSLRQALSLNFFLFPPPLQPPENPAAAEEVRII